MTSLDLNIDPANLDAAIKSLPGEMDTFQNQLAEAIGDLNTAEHRLTVLRARTSLAIRKNPESFGYPKVTEDLIKALVEVQDDVIKATQVRDQADKEVKLLRAVCETLDTKRSMVKYMSELVISGFVLINSPIPGVRK